jgi:hypothetical protein
MFKLERSCLALLLIGLACGLAGCLTGQQPNLSAGDLIAVEGFAGTYQATVKSDATGQSAKAGVRIEAQADRSYRVFLIENGQENPEPMLARILPLERDAHLVVITKPGSDDIAQFASLTAGDKGTWSLTFLDIADAHRNDTLAPIVARHGASVDFRKGFGKSTDDRLKGALTAQQLRELYNDPDFLAATRVLATIALVPES